MIGCIFKFMSSLCYVSLALCGSSVDTINGLHIFCVVFVGSLSLSSKLHVPTFLQVL